MAINQSPRDAAFIKDMMNLGQHYDGAIGYTEFRGGAQQFSGFRVMKIREFEALALKYGKRFTYDSQTMHAVAVDDVDGPPITPASPETFFTTLFGAPEVIKGPAGGSVQLLSATARQASSSSVRNVLASKAVLDVWIKKGTVTVWTIPPSRITNGLFEQAQKAAPNHPVRRKWSAAGPGRLRKKAGKVGAGRRAYSRLRAMRQGQQQSPRKPKSSSFNESKKSKATSGPP